MLADVLPIAGFISVFLLVFLVRVADLGRLPTLWARPSVRAESAQPLPPPPLGAWTVTQAASPSNVGLLSPRHAASGGERHRS